MSSSIDQLSFASINSGFDHTFQLGRLTVGLVLPLESYSTWPVPTMDRHLQRVQLAEQFGYAAVWLRDVPFNVPSFGDAGQVFDPFVYLGLLAGATERLALGVASIVLPLRHPVHVAKAAASVDALSGGRLILGVASGDRPDEYPALNIPFADRGQQFRHSFEYLRRLAEDRPMVDGPYGNLRGDIDLLPKPVAGSLPLLITGSSQQDADWIADNGDGWMLYPRDADTQSRIIGDWRARVESAGHGPRPIMQPLYIDLADDPNLRPQPFHLGFRSGVNALRSHLSRLEQIGVNHVALNLRFNEADIEQTLERLADEVLPHFTLSGEQ